MSEDLVAIKEKPKARLKFIDMARSLAILLMLEGHFTGAALGSEYRDYEYSLFKVWHIVHGLTSPLFFTVTGIIFVYLLTAKKDISFKNNIRVKKGRKRVFQLLFWGYAIQFNLWVFGKDIYYGTGFHMDWFYAFHVLQSIGIGLAIVILIYGLYKFINIGKIHWYYFFAGVAIFALYAIMKDHIMMDKKLIEAGADPNYWPKNVHPIIQNMFYGKFSDFSFVRMSGYTIFGGMIGAIIRTYEHRVREWWFGMLVIVIGLLMAVFIRDVFIWVDHFTEWIGLTERGLYEWNSTSISRLGQVIVLIGILILVDKYFKVKSGLFLKVGQNTFPVYVVHVIILYGGLFGFGLKPHVFDRDLSPWAAITVAITAIAFFILMVAYIEPLEKLYNNVLFALRLKKRPELKVKDQEGY